MSYEPKNGSGGLWKNQFKTEDRHPTAKGYIIAHRDIKQGERIDVAAWTKTDRNGNKYQSLQIDDPRPRADQPAEQPDPGADTAREPNDEIPF